MDPRLRRGWSTGAVTMSSQPFNSFLVPLGMRVQDLLDLCPPHHSGYHYAARHSHNPGIEDPPQGPGAFFDDNNLLV